VLTPSNPNHALRSLVVKPSPATLIVGMSRDSDWRALKSTYTTIGRQAARSRGGGN